MILLSGEKYCDEIVDSIAEWFGTDKVRLGNLYVLKMIDCFAEANQGRGIE